MNKPNPSQVFFATFDPFYLWLSLFAMSALVYSCWVWIAAFPQLAWWERLAGIPICLFVAPLFGCGVGLLSGAFFLPLFCAALAGLNGGPFMVGHTVQIIAGKHKGKVTTIYSMGQGISVRVRLGVEEETNYTDIFLPSQLLRIDNVNPPAPLQNESDDSPSQFSV